MIKNFKSLGSFLEKQKPLRLGVIGATDPEVMQAVTEAAAAGWVVPELIVWAEKTEFNAGFPVHKVTDSIQGARLGVELVHNQALDLLMKGKITSADFLRPVVAKEKGLVVAGRNLSHVALFELPNRESLTFLSDAAVMIEPDFEQKIAIIQNGLEVVRAFGYAPPRVAVLSALEKVNRKILSSVEAGKLAELATTGCFGDALVSGPLALDNALDLKAVVTKGLEDDPVAGRADLLIMPELVSANVLYKSFTVISGYPGAGVVVGAEIPLILTSRADSHQVKLNSIAVACFLRHVKARMEL